MKIIRQHFSTIDSTNDYGLRNARLFDAENVTLITADRQEKGRGRGKRVWFSPENKNIYASFCFFLPDNRKDVGNLSQLLAVSACEVLLKWGLQPIVKWPNDILISNKKIAGVLCEVKQMDANYFIVDGIGINVNMSKEEMANLDKPATSVREEVRMIVDQSQLLRDLQLQFIIDLQGFIKDGFRPFFDSFSRFVRPFLKKEIQFHESRRIWNGIFHSLNDDGSLNLQLPSGEIRRFYAGDILF